MILIRVNREIHGGDSREVGMNPVRAQLKLVHLFTPSVLIVSVILVPKAGLYQEGLLKSLMAWAIPLSFLAIHSFTHSVLFGSLCR